ncbi:MAG: hypothetical protein Kow0029_13480 [Candidatus Rifleibacteriota bacterium]
MSSGVTLIEILISLAILVMVTAAVSGGTNDLTRRMVRAKNAGIARNLAWKRLAEVKSALPKPGKRSGIFGGDFPGYKFDEELKNAVVNGKGLGGLYEYSLTVTWPEAYKEDRVTFRTYIADYVQVEDQVASKTAYQTENEDG